MAIEKPKKTIIAADFKPVDQQAVIKISRYKPQTLLLGLGLGLILLVILSCGWFLLSAKSVIFKLDPIEATIDISGLLNFHIGANYLLLSGEHTLEVIANGYFPLQSSVLVTERKNQQHLLTLKPLPGSLKIDSNQQNLKVVLDGEITTTAPRCYRKDLPW